MLGSVLTAQSLEPVSDSVSPFLLLPLVNVFMTIILNLKMFFNVLIYFRERERENEKKNFNVYLFLRQKQSVNRGGAEREGNTESETVSRL